MQDSHKYIFALSISSQKRLAELWQVAESVYLHYEHSTALEEQDINLVLFPEGVSFVCYVGETEAQRIDRLSRAELETETKNPHPQLCLIIHPITNLEVISQWHLLNFRSLLKIGISDVWLLCM